ncbi:MAG: collagen binding domain-containing protein [Pyrinomonadaceae bacterium]
MRHSQAERTLDRSNRRLSRRRLLQRKSYHAAPVALPAPTRSVKSMIHTLNHSVRPLLFGALLCLALQPPLGAQTQRGSTPANSGAVSGRVTVRREPAPGVEVRLSLLDDQGLKPTPLAKATTDKAGRYRFAGLAPGRYAVQPAAPGLFVADEVRYGQPGKSVLVQEGEAASGVDFDLVPVGRISGRVTDADGRPVAGQYVKLSAAGDGGYPRQFVPRDQSQSVTNESGAYRFDGVPAGRYLVSVGRAHAEALTGERGAPHFYYALSYHPAAAEASAAEAVEVPAGGEVEGVDVTAGPLVRVYDLAGRVVEAATGEPLAGVDLTVIVKDDAGRVRSDISGPWRSDARGEFRVEGAPPGHYLILPQDDARSNTYGVALAVEVTDRDAAGLEIRMPPGASVSGTVLLAGGAGELAGGALPAGLGVWARVESSGDHASSSSSVKINGDGSFRAGGLRPGRVRLALTSMTPAGERGFTLLRVETAAGAPLSDGLEVGPGEAVTGLRLTLGRGTGVLRGRVQVEGGELAGVHLYVNYRWAGDAPNSYHRAELDARGRFVVEHLVAGDYELMVGPMSVEISGAGGEKTASRLPSVRQTVTVSEGGAAEVTLVLALRP